jgi:murein DD-endopeptidase MepM/ murein hydrolase activator NlpD
MRKSLSAYRSRLLDVAAVTALCGVAASCSSFLDRPLYTGATTNQREIILSSTDRPLPAPTTGVTRVDLPPPPGSTVAMATPPAATYQATPVVPAGSATGDFVWTAVGGKVITVKAGENLELIAAKYGVPPSQILHANQLVGARQVMPGRTLVIPHLVMVSPGEPQLAANAVPAPTPAAAPTVAAATRPQSAGGTYTVISGDTLYSISRRHGTNPETIIALNDLRGQSQIKAGQVLKLPAAAGSSSSPAAIAEVPKPTPAPVQLASNGPLPNIVLPQASPPAKPPAVSAVASGTQIPATQASLTPPRAAVDDDAPSANGTTFRWPVRGRIITGFGSSPGGQRNDGINLAVPEGTSVKAAEAGTVIYAGNELEGYGNLILVRHADGWVTAYAHNKDLAVKRGDTVARGQIIARAGMTGSVSTPQVHFELRQGSKPVNPLDHLSG